MTKIYNIWCSPFLSKLWFCCPAERSLPFSYQCQYEQGRRAKHRYPVRGVREVEKPGEDVDLSLPGPFLNGGVESILQESKLSDLKCSSLTKPLEHKIPSPG